MDTFREQLNKFIIENNIVGTSVGVGIGLATKDVIHSFVSDILFPVFYLLVFKLNVYCVYLGLFRFYLLILLIFMTDWNNNNLTFTANII